MDDSLFLDPCRLRYVSTGLFFKAKKIRQFFIVLQSFVDLLEFNKTLTTGSKQHKIYVGMSTSMYLQVFTEIQ